MRLDKEDARSEVRTVVTGESVEEEGDDID